MDERQHAWLQNFLGVPVPLPVGGLTVPARAPLAFADAPEDAGTRSDGGSGGCSNAPPPAAPQLPATPSPSRGDQANATVAFTSFVHRYKAITTPDQTFETVAANKAYAAAFNPFLDAWNAKDYAKAVTLVGSAEAALN